VNMVSSRMQSAGTRLVVLASFLALSTSTVFADDKGVFGYWKRLDEDSGKVQSIFRLWEDKGKLVGKIVKIYPKANGEKPQEVCTECAGAQKDKPVTGLIFMWDFVKEEGNAKKWTDGKVLNPENGKTYNSEVTLSDDGQTLSVYGYIRVVVKLGGSSKWVRATAEDIKSL
jgi:uncharacterized protein (DUF2147 family)